MSTAGLHSPMPAPLPTTAPAPAPEPSVAEIFASYRQILQRRCRGILRDPDLSDDAVQLAFLRLLRYRDSYLSAPSRRAWLLRACDQVCFNLRWQRARIARTEITCLDEAGVGPDSGADLERRELLARLHGRLDELQRHLLVCAYVDGQSAAEIARATGWSRQTIHAKLAAIRQAARRIDRTAA